MPITVFPAFFGLADDPPHRIHPVCNVALRNPQHGRFSVFWRRLLRNALRFPAPRTSSLDGTDLGPSSARTPAFCDFELELWPGFPSNELNNSVLQTAPKALQNDVAFLLCGETQRPSNTLELLSTATGRARCSLLVLPQAMRVGNECIRRLKWRVVRSRAVGELFLRNVPGPVRRSARARAVVFATGGTESGWTVHLPRAGTDCAEPLAKTKKHAIGLGLEFPPSSSPQVLHNASACAATKRRAATPPAIERTALWTNSGVPQEGIIGSAHDQLRSARLGSDRRERSRSARPACANPCAASAPPPGSRACAPPPARTPPHVTRQCTPPGKTGAPPPQNFAEQPPVAPPVSVAAATGRGLQKCVRESLGRE